MADYDTSVVGAGPNGLAAAVEMARNGRRVVLFEAADEIGGGTRTAELTLPGYKHDICSAIHPSGVASPFFQSLDLEIDWIQPPIPFTHPLGGGRVAALHRSVDETAGFLGDDAASYRRVMGPLVEEVDSVIEDTLSPIGPIPSHAATFARVAALGGLSAAMLISRFETVEARALLSGLAAHAIAPFSRLTTSGVALLLGVLGHSHGWPLAQGGSQAIADGLADRLESQGGRIETGVRIESLDELEGSTAILDVMPPAAAAIVGSRLSRAARVRADRWRPGPGVFKLDLALDAPIPWSDEMSGQTATVHVGGSYEEVRAAEDAVYRGEHPEFPFVLLAQQSLFDDTRAPEGKHTAWAYCHVPNGSPVDMTERIEAQIERFAPGFRDVILARATMSSAQYEAHNPNYVGGDIGGGIFGLRKVLQLGDSRPYRLGEGIYLCSSATPPGGGVHGMCGYYAAQAALR